MLLSEVRWEKIYYTPRPPKIDTTLGNYPVLLCPNCGYSYMHEGPMKAREEGWNLDFYCEAGKCPKQILTISQHKGQTFIYWQPDDASI